MADEVINTRIVANADFSSLIADVHRVTASLSKLQEQLANSNKMLANNVAVINRSFADTIRSTGQFSSHFVSLTSDVEKFGKNLDSGRLKLRDYFNTYQQHAKTTGGLIRQLAQQQVAMQNAVLQPLGRNAQGLMQFNVHVPRGLDAIKNKTALARQELQIMNKVIQDGAVQLINWGKNTQWAGRQLTVGLTLPLAAFGRAAANAFKTADQELTRLTKVYGGVAATSAAELKKIRQEVSATAAQLAKEYGASFQETISLAADIAATGKQGNELLASTREATRLAVLGEVDRQDAMKATLAIQTAFKQNTAELSDSINFLNAVENQTSTSLADLVEAIPKAGPVIKGLGGSVQDLALYLTAMREGGISASEGANALKSGLASLINPTDKAVGQFKSFGIDLLGIVNSNAGNVTKTLLDLQAALDKLNPLQKQQAIENLFGKFQFARMNALFENLGKQGSQTLQVLDLMKASTADLANIAGRELTQVTESASGKYRRALESLKADLAGVGEEFLSIGTKVINIIDKAINFFNGLPKPVKTAITFIGGLTALAGPLIMLTGLLANFFGYILKGAMHMKAFFKGGEGWKYLTPEMIAAEKAGKLVEQTFYSDAKAASILQLALKNLIDEFTILEAKAKSGSISVNPAVSTMAGNLVMAAGAGRVVNPQHPLAGQFGSRASTHMVPRGSMTEEQRMQQTIFGLVPGAEPVNRKIGNNPQIYMHEALPNIPGLTTIGGASTGVVAGEAARWHSMMAVLAMQSKEEVAQLKKTIATTGIVTKDFMNQFDQILPVVSSITDNAAKQSSLIVAELRAGKLTVDQAKEQIIALNLQIERDITAAVGAEAAAMGRTLNPTAVPTLNQPAFDATGKSNMRELFKKGKTKSLINKIASSLGVRTSGAGYNIETTRPRKFADGGTVVGGPRSDKTDTQYAVLNEGDFVLNRAASDNILGFNRGGQVPAMVTPGEIIIHNPSPNELSMLEAYNNKFALGGRVMSRQNHYGQTTTAQAMQMIRRATQFHENPNYNENMRISAITSDASILHGMGMDPQAAIQMATADYDDAIRYATGKDGTFSLNRFTRRRTELLKQIKSNAPRLGLSISPVYSGTGRQPSFSRFDKGIANIQNLIMKSDKFSQGSKSYLSSLGLQAPVGERSWVRGHYQRMGGLNLQGLEYLYQAAAIPSEINSFWATTENKRLAQDLLIPVAEGRGGARALLQRTIQAAAQRGGYRRQQVPTPADVLASRRAASPLQRMLQAALASSYATRRPALARFATGGVVRSGVNNYGRFSTAFKAGATPKPGGNFDPNSGMMSSLAGFGVMTAGQFIPGPIGQGMQLAGLAMQLMPIFSMIGKVSKGFTTLGGTITKFGTIAGRIFLGLKNAIAVLTGPIGITIALLTTAFALWKKFQADAEKRREGQTSMFGLSQKGAKELGIQYTTLTDKMKAVREEQKLMADNAKAKFEAYTSAGISGISLTIKQLKDLKDQVKTTMPEMLKTLNNLDSSQVTQWAANVKAQMIAAGKSVQDANNLIYALIESSNKAGMGVQVLTDKIFNAIQDKGSAAAFTMKTLADNFDNVANIDSKAFASNIDTAVNSIDLMVTGLIGTKDATGKILTEADAVAIAFDKMSESGIKNKEITSDVLDIIKKERPELAAILNQGDTIGGMYAKWRIVLSGVALDIKNLTSDQAEMIAQFQSGLDTAAATATTVGNSLSGVPNVATTLKKVNDAQLSAAKKATAAANGQLGANKELIKSYQNTIKVIREQAEAKKKALQDSLNADNTQLELQKLQLDYQQALARGDKDAAMQAQIAIRQLSKQYETQKAIDQIDANAKRQEAAQQALIDAENAKDNTGAKTGQKYNDLALKLAASSAAITGFATRFTALGNQLAQANMMTGPAKAEATNLVKQDFSVFMKDLIDSANKDPNVAQAFSNLLVKGKDGKYTAAVDKTYRFPKQGEVTMGGAFSQLSTLSTSMTNFAKDIMGKSGISLSEINETLRLGFKLGTKDTNKRLNVSVTSVTTTVGGQKQSGNYVDPYDLYMAGVDKTTGTVFTDKNGNKWKIVGPESAAAGNKIPVAKAATGGMIRHYGPGGDVSGPGTSTSDSIPAMLSDGEYVIRASSVDKYGKEFFDGLNTQKFASGGPVRNKVISPSHMSSSYKAPKSLIQKIWDNFLFPTVLWADRLQAGLSDTRPIASTNQIQEELWIKQMKEKGIKSVLPSMLGQQAFDFGSLALGAGASNALGRSFIEQYGISRGIPALGQLLPKGSIPYATSAGSKLAQNATAAAIIGGSKPFLESKAASTFNYTKPSILKVAEDPTLSKKSLKPDWIEYEGNKIPTYSGGIFKGKRIVYEGLGDDFSGLLKTGMVDEVINTSPEGLLSYILSKNPNNPELQAMLTNFKLGPEAIGPKETSFLTKMFAATYFKKGAKKPNQNIVDMTNMAALSGSKETMNMLDVKEASGLESLIGYYLGDKKSILDLKLKTKALNPELKKLVAEYKATTKKNLETSPYDLTPEQVPMIRSYNYGMPNIDEKGFINEPAAGFAIYKTQFLPSGRKAGATSRATRHLSINDEVQSSVFHMGSSWKSDNPMMVTSLATARKYNYDPEQLHAFDTVWLQRFGKPFRIPKEEASLIFPITGKQAYQQKLIERGLLKNGEIPKIITEDPATKEIFYLSKKKYSDKELQEIVNEFDKDYNLPNLRRMIQEEKTAHDRKMGHELTDTGNLKRGNLVYTPNRALRMAAINRAKKQLGIDTPYSQIIPGADTPELGGRGIEELAKRLGIKYSSAHQGTGTSFAESIGYDTDNKISGLSPIHNPLEFLLSHSSGVTSESAALGQALLNEYFGKTWSGKWPAKYSKNPKNIINPRTGETVKRNVDVRSEAAIAEYVDSLVKYKYGESTVIPDYQGLIKQLSFIAKEIKQNSILVAKGGYIGKLHDWNGPVPGPYGQEVSAVLKSGTEGVYQNAYINSLKNNSMPQGSVYNTYDVKIELNGTNVTADDVMNKFKSEMALISAREGRGRKIGGPVNVSA